MKFKKMHADIRIVAHTDVYGRLKMSIYSCKDYLLDLSDLHISVNYIILVIDCKEMRDTLHWLSKVRTYIFFLKDTAN